MKPLLLGLLLPLLAGAQTPFPYQLKGKIAPQPATAKVYLLYNGRLLDSTRLHNGAFELRGTSDVPKRAQVVLAADGKTPDLARPFSFNSASIFLEPGPLLITSPSAVLRFATVRGGRATQDYQRLMKQDEAFLGYLLSHRPTQLRVVTWEQNIVDQQQRKQVALNFIKNNPASWASLDILLQPFHLGPPQYDEVAPLYESLSPTLRNSAPGQAYGRLVQSLQVVALGSPAPDFSLLTPENKTLALKDFRGQYVLLDFWASGCDDCRLGFGIIRSLRQQYQGRNFEVVGISLDKNISQKHWLRTIREHDLTWPQASDLKGVDGNAAALSYRVTSVPQNFLIDPTGKIVGINLYGPRLQAALAKLLPAAAK
ncbi:MAG TPA: TlpA disulfide reductase family protein [Hymenobacter sp.]|uniref:TlpA disulfide reductase family protein n=1 Tax=Hymenobacter sp. TaxID=1898978 RepID=UPI002D7F8BA8|nr:TlpA disulfide reductase family protein [Hymenobacter sp.]HET9502750.1 TlpA disulfide reductase family protein [Hymenobacter sp.]